MGALFTNNVAALRAAIAQIDAGNAGTTVYIYAALMVTSILLQAVTGAAVVYLGRTDMNTAHQERARRSERLNHIVALLSLSHWSTLWPMDFTQAGEGILETKTKAWILLSSTPRLAT